MSMDDDNIHLLPLDSYNEFNEFGNASNESEDDDSVEVVSNIDVEEHNIVDMTKNLIFSSDDDIHYLSGDKNHGDFARGVSDNIRSSYDDTGLESDVDASDDSVESYSLNLSVPSPSSHSSSTTTNDIRSGYDKIENGAKRKRRQWSVEENLDALTTLKLNQNKHQTAVQHGCTRAQLRNWLANEMKLINLSKVKKVRSSNLCDSSGYEGVSEGSVSIFSLTLP